MARMQVLLDKVGLVPMVKVPEEWHLPHSSQLVVLDLVAQAMLHSRHGNSM